MTVTTTKIYVTLEIGNKRIFASALDWPGWARSGRSEEEAINALFAYGARYQHAISSASIRFHAPDDLKEFEVIERLTGDSTTDFGAPNIPPSADSTMVDAMTLKHLQMIIDACWKYFGEVAQSASGKDLRKGPRGGGRTVEQIIGHVFDSHLSYLRMIYWRKPYEKINDLSKMIGIITRIDALALEFATSEEMPKTGPRGGRLWQPRYFVRRAAWHVLDHAWEIEDRLEL